MAAPGGVLSDAQRLARLRWRCRRGMRELDALLMRFVDERWCAATADEQSAFERFLDLPDPEILGLLMGRARGDDPATDVIVGLILDRPTR